jgi:hypothetical protein
MSNERAAQIDDSVPASARSSPDDAEEMQQHDDHNDDGDEEAHQQAAPTALGWRVAVAFRVTLHHGSFSPDIAAGGGDQSGGSRDDGIAGDDQRTECRGEQGCRCVFEDRTCDRAATCTGREPSC